MTSKTTIETCKTGRVWKAWFSATQDGDDHRLMLSGVEGQTAREARDQLLADAAAVYATTPRIVLAKDGTTMVVRAQGANAYCVDFAQPGQKYGSGRTGFETWHSAMTYALQRARDDFGGIVFPKEER